MANTRLKIQFASNTRDQLIKGVIRHGSRAFARSVISKGQVITTGISTMLVKAFNNSDVARALRGQGATDLPAHFGLSDSDANSLADGMAGIIGKSVRLISKRIGGSVSIRIQAVSKDWNLYLGLPGAQYISRPSNITIPIAKWLLIDPNIDIGQAAYDIVFLGDDKKLDVRIQKVSRSGRAIMVSLESLGGSGGYVLPDIVSGRGGQNFIEYTLGKPGIAKEAVNILMSKIGGGRI